MQWLVYIYYMLMGIALIMSIFSYKYERKFLALILLLVISVLTEIIVEILKFRGQGHFIVYRFFTFFECTILVYFIFMLNSNKLVKGVALFFLLSFLLLFIGDTYFKTSNRFPSLINTAESIILSILAILSLLTLKPLNKHSIFSHPVFWFLLAILIYFSGTFFFNGLYNTLKEENQKKAYILYTIINSIFNYFFYLLLIKGFLCILKEQKLNR